MKPEDWDDMTAAAQKIRVAECWGWTQLFVDKPLFSDDSDTPVISKLMGYPPGDREPKVPIPVPDVLNDLNAMHEAEKVLGDKVTMSPHWFDYRRWLIPICEHPCPEHATAAQRCKAFVLTMEGE